MKSEPFLSIIVPVYNVRDYLEQCLESILNQNFQDYELILVNDGSKDDSGSICEKYASKYHHIHLINKKNGGLVSARKAGVRIARGKYTGFVDPDDLIEASMFAILCNEAKTSGSDVVICDVWSWKPGTNEKIKLEQAMEGGVFDKAVLEHKVYPGMLCDKSFHAFGLLPAMWNKIYKTDILKRNQMQVDERIRIGEDTACSYFCILEADQISYLKGQYLYYYRVNDDSMCKSWSDMNISGAAALLDYLYKRFEHQYEMMLPSYWRYYVYIFTNMIYEYEMDRIKKGQKDDIYRLVSEQFVSNTKDTFKSIYKTTDIPHTKKIMISAVLEETWIKKAMFRLLMGGMYLKKNLYLLIKG